MKLSAKSGSTLAAAAAALLLTGAMTAPVAYAAGETGHCMGANACKGQSACKTSTNACKGQNACKGKGFTESSKDDCAKAKGKFEAAADHK